MNRTGTPPSRSLALTALAAVAAALTMTFALALLSDRGGAQEPAKKPAAAPAPVAKQPAPAAAPQQPAQVVVMPEAEKIVLLLRTTLLTLNDALQTGNYTVLRDVAAPGFRDANSAARLSAIFGNLTGKGVDLTAVAILMPQLTDAPVLDEKAGMVRIKGFFPGQPVRVDFEVLYQAVDGRWRLFGLSVQPTPVVPVAAATAVAPKAPDAKAEKKVEPFKTEPPKKK